jgi:hypothetical protein
MKYLKDLGFNFLILLVIGIALFVIFPDMMRQIFQIYGALFGPLIFLMVLVIALPRKRRRRR